MSEIRKLPQSVEQAAEESKPTTSSSNADRPPSGPTRRAVLRSAALAATGGALLGAAGSARAGEYQAAQGSMMFMQGHNMIGARTNPPAPRAIMKCPTAVSI